MKTRRNPLPLLPFLAAFAGTATAGALGAWWLKENPPEIPETVKDDLEDAVSSGVSGAVVMSGLGVGLTIAMLTWLARKGR